MGLTPVVIGDCYCGGGYEYGVGRKKAAAVDVNITIAGM